MLIEYKIKFEDDGVTISQRVDPGPVRAEDTPVKDTDAAVTRLLSAAFMPPAHGAAAGAGSGANPEVGPGGGANPEVGPGGGANPEVGPGGGGPPSVPIVILGPIVVGGSARTRIRRDAPSDGNGG